MACSALKNLIQPKYVDEVLVSKIFTKQTFKQKLYTSNEDSLTVFLNEIITLKTKKP